MSVRKLSVHAMTDGLPGQAWNRGCGDSGDSHSDHSEPKGGLLPSLAKVFAFSRWTGFFFKMNV